MRTVTIRALLLSTASCILVGVLFCWFFARRFGPAKAESSGRLNLLDNRLRQLEDTTTRLSRALDLLSRKVDDIAKIPKDSTTPTQILKDPSIAPREMESSAKVWVPVPWEMRFAGGD